MNFTQATLVGLCVLALVVVAFFAVFQGKGKFKIKTKLGEASAEGENPPPPANVAGGVKIKGAEAGGKITAHSTSAGGTDLENVKAVGDISATHTPRDSPPKA
jgi:hypothetical protein